MFVVANITVNCNDFIPFLPCKNSELKQKLLVRSRIKKSLSLVTNYKNFLFAGMQEMLLLVWLVGENDPYPSILVTIRYWFPNLEWFRVKLSISDLKYC